MQDIIIGGPKPTEFPPPPPWGTPEEKAKLVEIQKIVAQFVNDPETLAAIKEINGKTPDQMAYMDYVNQDPAREDYFSTKENHVWNMAETLVKDLNALKKAEGGSLLDAFPNVSKDMKGLVETILDSATKLRDQGHTGEPGETSAELTSQQFWDTLSDSSAKLKLWLNVSPI